MQPGPRRPRHQAAPDEPSQTPLRRIRADSDRGSAAPIPPNLRVINLGDVEYGQAVLEGLLEKVDTKAARTDQLPPHMVREYGITDLVTWAVPPGMRPEQMNGSLERFVRDVAPRVKAAAAVA